MCLGFSVFPYHRSHATNSSHSYHLPPQRTSGQITRLSLLGSGVRIELSPGRQLSWIISEFLGFFFGVLPFPQFHSNDILHFQSRTISCHFIFLFIHFMSSFTSFTVRKMIGLEHRWYNHAGWLGGAAGL